ncbi:MAG: hypothetical protein C0611_07975 [Desulfobacteraceae bacterium]|nr:MAG: hypothetical protein C0611_07975 [Desulfobacteraceae bacterium]
MDEIQATKTAEILGGQTWQSGGDMWLVVKQRADGHFVVISEEVICEYASEEDFESNQIKQSILLI